MTDTEALSRPADDPARRASAALTALFTATAFVGASLLFLVQPMVARLLLPSYGGSATVWSTSSLFFQVLLLVGYLYAHWSSTRLGPRWQPRAHLVVLLLPLVALPVALPADAAPSADSSPVLWLLRTLALVIGLPFVVVSTTGPLLQRWYSWTDARRADDPYFLFAASNLGSFGGLLAYPFLVEPTLTLDQQQRAWSIGFVVYVVLTGACAVVAVRRRVAERELRATGATARLATWRVVRWLGFAFLPSALMLAVTSHISTDVAAIPLLWIVPLAIYLATFVAAFARSSREVSVTLTRLAVALGMVCAVTGATTAIVGPALVQIAIGMATLAAVGFVAHARLAADRPEAEHLTLFYVVVAVGGALGGVLNGFLAPVLFDRVLEYALVMAAVPLLLLGVPVRETSWLDRLAQRSVWWGLILVSLAVTVGWGAWRELGGDATRLPWYLALAVLVCLLAFRVATRPLVVALVMVLLFGVPMAIRQYQALDQSRTFYGSYEVLARDGQHMFVHGTTVHGTQYLDERSTTPTSYYARSGPLGDVFALAEPVNVGAVGLGAGTIAAYGEQGMSLTFVEIDPEVVRIAQDPELFTYLADSRADVRVVTGDGRLALADMEDRSFDLLVLDAFSSDAIPVHLLTQEAFAGYARTLRPGALVAVHISNRSLDLRPVLRGVVDELGWDAVMDTGQQDDEGAALSEWVVISEDRSKLDALVRDFGWSRLRGATLTWTDSSSSILGVLR